MPTTQLPIDGVFDTATGSLVGFAAPSGPEISLPNLSGGLSASASGAILDSGSVPVEKLERALSVANVGLDGVSDDASRLQEALDSLCVAGVSRSVDFAPLVLRGASSVKINSGLTLKMPQLAVRFGGLTIDASGMTSGAALSITGQNVIPYNQHSSAHSFTNFKLLGPANPALPVDGILIGVDSTVPGHASFEDFLVKDFRDNLNIGNNVYILQFRNAFIKEAYRYGLNYTGVSNTGESINFFGGSISDTQNAQGNGTAIYVPSSAAGPDLFFHGTSFSYNDISFDIYCGQSNFKSCHFEVRKSNAPAGYVATVGGRPATTVVIDGGQVTHGTLATGTELSNGRPHFFVIRPNTGDRLYFGIKHVGYNGFDKRNTELVHFQGNGLVEIDVDSNNFTANGNPPRICSSANLLNNGDFAFIGVPSATVSAGGSGYTSAPTVTFSGGTLANGGSQATATAVINAGAVTAIVMRSPGSYAQGSAPPTINISGGGGSGATATADAFVIPGWSISDGGNTVTQDATYNTDPAGINSWVSAIAVTAGGSGYSANTVATISGGSVVGAQATATVTVTAGVVTGITVTYGGSYTPNGTPPTVTITDSGGGSGATATATLLTNKRALKIVGTGGTTTRSQTVPVKPGKKLAVRGFNRCDAFTSGSIQFTIEWLDSTGTAISTQTIASNLAATSAYAIRGNHYRVPRGAVNARINLIANAFTGTCYFADIEAWLI